MAYTHLLPGTTILEITGPEYNNLTDCAKWCLNGCRDANGNQNETNCGTSYYPPNWEDYEGLAASQDCTTVDCLCNKANFNSAVAKLIESSREYCGMPVSTPQAPYPPYDDMQDVFVNYCLRQGYSHHNYTAVVVGTAPTGNSSTLNDIGAGSNIPTKQNSKLVTIQRTYYHKRKMLKLFRLVTARYFDTRSCCPQRCLLFRIFSIPSCEVLE
jgi:hypothetical protein